MDVNLDVNRVSQQLQRGLMEGFALGRVRMNDRGDILKACAHLDRQAEGSRQFRNAGTHTLDSGASISRSGTPAQYGRLRTVSTRADARQALVRSCSLPPSSTSSAPCAPRASGGATGRC